MLGASTIGCTSAQKHVFVLGWTLDDFDLFLLVFVLKDTAEEFNTQITEAGTGAILIAVLTALGVEAKDVSLEKIRVAVAPVFNP
jgi:hypothetical protein